MTEYICKCGRKLQLKWCRHRQLRHRRLRWLPIPDGLRPGTKAQENATFFYHS